MTYWTPTSQASSAFPPGHGHVHDPHGRGVHALMTTGGMAGPRAVSPKAGFWRVGGTKGAALAANAGVSGRPAKIFLPAKSRVYWFPEEINAPSVRHSSSPSGTPASPLLLRPRLLHKKPARRRLQLLRPECLNPFRIWGV